MEIVQRQARSFNPETQARTSWLAKATEFQEWFRAERSSLLLADGCITDHSGLVTPMSGFCATLISSLMESKHNTVLFFFAGEHYKLDSPDHRGNGPNSLMRSLISQLLACSALAEPDLTFLSREYLEDLENYELEALYDLFDNLMQQLPPTSELYCIIDGISWYEQQRWLYDLERVAAMFEYVARRQRKNPRKLIPLKLLMTSSGKSIELVKRSRDSGSVWKHVSLAAGQAIPGVPRFGV
ncbi:hypothetical protein F4825DRAFT_433076 [Nemania diffusa]|nr:hypothetical protein F4825DRAFT_433076 [Nemania diffusa]